MADLKKPAEDNQQDAPNNTEESTAESTAAALDDALSDMDSFMDELGGAAPAESDAPETDVPASDAPDSAASAAPDAEAQDGAAPAYDDAPIYDDTPAYGDALTYDDTPEYDDAPAGAGVADMLHGMRDADYEQRAAAAERKAAGKKAAKKNARKRGKRPMTIEEDIADLEQEEKEYDEWGRKIRKKRRKHRKSRKLSCTLVLLTLIVALSSVLSASILAVAKEMYGIEKDNEEKVINIPAGSTVTSIAAQLQEERMISLPQVFRLVSRMNGKDGSYIAGEHVLSPSMSYETMIEELCTNHVEEREYVRVTFREGITLLDAARILQENEVCNADDFLFYFNGGGWGFKFESYLPETKNPLKFQQMEGYCFPDTYEFYVGEEPNIVAQKIYANFDSKLTDGDYKKMEELNMTLDEVITLASIVQGEAPFPDSMKMVASIFHNRLNNSAIFPLLQSDPTRKYAENVIAPNLQIANDLMCDAYNTYTGQGLPPGAINNPGRDAIEAVLYPAESPYFFFNANIDTGEIFYAITNEEHERNLALVEQQYAEAAAAANGG